MAFLLSRIYLSILHASSLGTHVADPFGIGQHSPVFTQWTQSSTLLPLRCPNTLHLPLMPAYYLSVELVRQSSASRLLTITLFAVIVIDWEIKDKVCRVMTRPRFLSIYVRNLSRGISYIIV